MLLAALAASASLALPVAPPKVEATQTTLGTAIVRYEQVGEPMLLVSPNYREVTLTNNAEWFWDCRQAVSPGPVVCRAYASKEGVPPTVAAPQKDHH